MEVVEQDPPFRLLDPSSRTLHWVFLGELKPVFDAGIVVCSPETSHYQIRPAYRVDGKWYRLCDDIHDRLVESGNPYQFEDRYVDSRRGWYVGFLHKEEAMLFKLSIDI